MEVLVLLIAASLALAGGFLMVFFWATQNGQFDDTTTPAMRILTEDPPAPTIPASSLPQTPNNS